MRGLVIVSALVALAVPVGLQAAPPKGAATTAAPANKAPDFDLGKMMAVFDKVFPAQPDPPATRLSLSRTAVVALFPDGTYARMMGGMMHGVAERVMGLTEADFGGKPASGKATDTMTLKQKLAKDDPNFDERMKIIERVMGEELAKMSAIMEPKMREGLARSMARRFDEKQLSDLNAFLATDSGKAFGSQSMAMWIDPDVMRAVMGSVPEMMHAMPEAMKRLEAETARLPKHPAAKPKPTG
jgi:hypothetical protein